MKIDVIILAAGLSRRMGLCKGLLPWQGGTLLDHACQVYGQLGGRRIVVVGHEKEAMQGIAGQYGFQTIVNKRPEWGQGHSLALGIRALEATLRPVLCAVVDQPLINAGIVQTLVAAYATSDETSKLIVCPQYGSDKERGNPVIFGAYWKQALQQITADCGGRCILQGIGKPYIRFVEIKEPVGVDIDTPSEYKQLYDMWGKL